MIQDGVEVVLIRTSGGPFPGTRSMPITLLAPCWPPPETIPAPGGAYRRRQLSSLPDSVVGQPNIARGAEYEWEPGEGGS